MPEEFAYILPSTVIQFEPEIVLTHELEPSLIVSTASLRADIADWCEANCPGYRVVVGQIEGRKYTSHAEIEEVFRLGIEFPSAERATQFKLVWGSEVVAGYASDVSEAAPSSHWPPSVANHRFTRVRKLVEYAVLVHSGGMWAQLKNL